MTVKVLYIVERGGKEVVSFANKKEADAYDKMLDISDEIFTLIEGSEITLNENSREDLSIYLAQNKDLLKRVLNGQSLDKAKEAEIAAQAPKSKPNKKATASE